MNATKPPRSLWPVAIITFFILAAIFLGTYIVWAFHQREDLVATNYYDNEIRYQQRLDQINRTQPLAAQVAVAYDSAQRRLVLTLPAAQTRNAAGRVFLYRPSDASLDRDLPLALDADGVQRLDASQLQSGLWKVRIQWNVGGADFFVDRSVVIKPARS